MKAVNKAKRARSGRPQLIIAKTIIAKGIPEVQGTAKGHGEGGAKFADAARAGLGLPADQTSTVIDFTFVDPQGAPCLKAVTFDTPDGSVTI